MVKVMMSLSAIVFFIFLGSIFFYLNNEFQVDGQRDFVNAFYWSFVTVTTVGYGDMNLKHDSSKVFSIFFILVATLVIATALGNFASVAAAMENEKKELEILLNLKAEDLEKMDKDNDGVCEAEYVLGMLQLMGKVDEKDLRFYELEFAEIVKKYGEREDFSSLEMEQAEETERVSEYRVTRAQLSKFGKQMMEDNKDRIKQIEKQTQGIGSIIKSSTKTLAHDTLALGGTSLTNCTTDARDQVATPPPELTEITQNELTIHEEL